MSGVRERPTRRPRRALLLATLLAVAVSGCGGGSGGAPDDGYRVRAIFDNAFGVTRGQEVRVGGQRAGRVTAVEVTADRRAAVVLRIDAPGARDFRRDAECSIQPQTAVDARHVACLPTQPRPAGRPAPAPLAVRSFDGQREALLPVENTSRPIDVDLLAGTARLSESERLAVIVDELGVGLAGRGPDLRRTIRAALPGLRETDRVLEIVDGQRRQLRQLAADGARALAPVARDRDRLGRVVARAADVQQAVADDRSALDANLARLPGSLAALRPTMRELERTAAEAVPTVRELRRSAGDGAQLLGTLEAFATSAKQPLVDLGKTADLGREALVGARPTVERTRRLADAARPLLRDARALTASLDSSGGFRSGLDAIYFLTLALNGYDDTGHYLRVNTLVDRCSAAAVEPIAGCSANQGAPNGGGRSSSGGRRTGESTEQALVRRLLGGADPQRLRAEARRDPAYRPLVQRLDQLDGQRTTAARRAARREATAGTSSSSARGQDDPITLDGGLLPGAPASGDDGGRAGDGG